MQPAPMGQPMAGQPGMPGAMPGQMPGQPGMPGAMPGQMPGQPGMPGAMPGQMPAPGYAQPGMPAMNGVPTAGGAPGQPMVMLDPYTGKPLEGMSGLDPGKMTVEQIFTQMKLGMFIKQKMDLMEVISGCDTPNKYLVHELQPSGGKKKKEIFRCKEVSGCCARNCMSSDCKPFDMKVSKVCALAEFDNEDTCIHMSRECKCSFLCCNRPEMKISIVENGQDRYLGKVQDNCDCVNFSFNVYDAQDKVRFFIKAGCCQLGFWCKCPCEPCEKIVFDFWSGDKEKEEAPILKTGAGNCIKNAISDSDNFSCQFPVTATWEDKVLLLGALLMIDFMMFEEKNNGKADSNMAMAAHMSD